MNTLPMHNSALKKMERMYKIPKMAYLPIQTNKADKKCINFHFIWSRFYFHLLQKNILSYGSDAFLVSGNLT